jgi:hypothetical protein
MKKGAVISECGKYRFRLWRIWDDSLPKVLWYMHNPSKADADLDDPTIRRCIQFSKDWGYGGLYVGNLFPYRATDPKELIKISYWTVTHPIENGNHIRDMERLCTLHIMAFGNPILKAWGPDLSVPELIDEKWHYLKLTKSGNPCHPLYLNSTLKPIIFNK